MSTPLLLACLALLPAAALLAGVLTYPARSLARRWGLVDRPGARKIHAEATPYGGGVAIVGAFVLLLAGAYLAAIGAIPLPGVGALREALAQHLGGLVDPQTVRRLGGILVGGLLMFVLGLVDDKRGLGPGVKLSVQAAAALLLWAAGVRVTLFVDHWAASLVFTLGWMLVVTNAMNLLDNMDGLAAGVGAIASLILLVLAIQGGQVFVAGALAVLAGTLLGFLVHNFHPASVFMGDAGALFVGYLLGALAMATTYTGGDAHVAAVVAPLVVLAIPLFDTASVLVIRWRRGAPLMQGDRNHFSHRLVRLGMTQREAVLTIYILTASLGVSATLLTRLDRTGAILVLLHTVGVLVVVALLEIAAHRKDSA
ncbi:MAG: glycosyltransferase family 4 protein [Planctomycetota bacterium]